MTHVLIVDDDPTDRDYLAALLRADYEVDAVGSGEEAVSLARRKTFSLVIADLLTQIKDGPILARVLQSNHSNQTVPFIVYTDAFASSDEAALARAMGANAIVRKPVEPHHFSSVVRDVLAAAAERSAKSSSTATADSNRLDAASEGPAQKLEERAIYLEVANRALNLELVRRNRSADLYKAAFEALPTQIAILDKDGLILGVNEAWRMFATGHGLRNPKLTVGGNYLEICDAAGPDWAADAAAVAGGLRHVLKGITHEFTFEHAAHLGTTLRWFRLVVTPLRGPLGVVVTYIDVTRETIAVAESRRHADRFRLALKAASIGTWEWFPLSGQLFWDDQMYEMYGMKVGEPVTYDDWKEVVHPDDFPAQEAALKALVEQGGESTREFRIRPAGGRLRHIFAAEKLVITNKDEAPSIVGINFDVTDSKKRQDEVIGVYSGLQTLIEQAPVGIIVHRQFEPMMANEELARIFGYDSKDEILRMKNTSVLIADDDKERIGTLHGLSLSGNTVPSSYSVKGKKKNGAIIDVEARSFPIKWGERDCVCVLITDVTVQKKMETQLRQSQRLEAVGQMTGGVAHDFNNLLTVILGNAELLEDALANDPELYNLAEITKTAAEKGAELTARLLAFSRRQALDPKVVDINRLVSNIEALIRRAIGKHIEITTILESNIWNAMVDGPQFESAILNLAVNARDAMPNGGHLTIETSNVSLDHVLIDAQYDIAPGEYVLISVSDTGTGMDEKTRLQAFEPFFTTKDVGKGSGLGLSMVYGLVKQSKGYIRIYSELGYGTTVKIYLPKVNADASRLARKVDPDGVPTGYERILVVEDEPTVRKQVSAQLQALGYQVVVAADGIEALEILGQRADFDLLFTDVVMPRGINGPKLAEEAKRLHPDLPVLFTSGYTENSVVHYGRLDSNVNLLNKPYRRRELALKVRAILDRSKPSASDIHSSDIGGAALS